MTFSTQKYPIILCYNALTMEEQLGEASLNAFTKTLSTLLIAEKRRFDMIVSAGNSGQIMMWLTKVVYESLGLPLPSTVVFPIYRYKDFPEKKLFDNSSILFDYASIRIPIHTKHILFVDDAIEQGNAAEATRQLLLALGLHDFFYTILAEDGRIEKQIIGKENTEYIFPQQRATEVKSAISYVIPKKYATPIQNILEKEHITWKNKHIMCMLLHLPIKELQDGKPIFSYRLEETVKRSSPNFTTLQREYQQYLKKKVIICLSI